VGTLVERKTLFTVLANTKNAEAEAALNGFGHLLDRIEAQKRLSLTYDQGHEMAAYQLLTQATGAKVYFADPHSPGREAMTSCYASICPRTLHTRRAGYVKLIFC